MLSPEAGAVIDGRFELRGRVGAGGMGVIFRARDLVTGDDVALKLLRAGPPVDALPPSASEVRILSELQYPGIVRYIAHGAASDGSPYIAMEWLEGEDLAARLERGPLGANEAAAFIARIAEIMVAPHDRGIIHRDIKPSNIFLLHGDITRPILLDFGVAEQVVTTARSGAPRPIVGSPAYMSPEQIRGQALDARTDIFALGCVLFECIAGVPAFRGASAVAVMAKIVHEEAPDLSEARPDAPPALAHLLRQLLAKDRAHRLPHVRMLAEELRAARLDVHLPDADTQVASAPISITSAEHRLVCVVLAEGPADTGATMDVDLAQLTQLTEAHGARVDVLLDGSIIAVVSGASSAIEMCEHAARYALSLRAMLPERRIAMATGRALLASSLPTGEAIESAVNLLSRGPKAARGIRADAGTVGLLSGRFSLTRDGVSAIVGPPSGAPPRSHERRLLGKPTPFVGRDSELEALEAMLAASALRSRAQAALVTGPAGSGKSRLLYELMKRVSGRGEVSVLTARADPISQGTPLGMIAALVRHAIGLDGAEAEEEARRKVAARVAEIAAATEAARITEFLGEICGLSFSDEVSQKLRAARETPMLMSDQTRLAFGDLLLGMTARRPVLLVLEDLQWGDQPTVDFVDAALRLLRHRPLFVLAAGRPEVEETFPELWEERRVTRLSLRELSREASEALVRAVLGAGLSAATVEAIVQRAAGNPFYLEELIRAVADGQEGSCLPESVLAMAQTRIEALPTSLRQIMRAASVFGERFWRGGLAVLLGTTQAKLDEPLGELIEREIILPRPTSQFARAGEQELAFRHSLVREAAYAMLPEYDRALGHRLAADWLNEVGETDALVLAQHLDRGGERARAVEAYVRAARHSLEANDLAAVLTWATRAEQCGASGDRLAEVRLLEATTHHWRANFAEGSRAALTALRDATPFSVLWYRAAEEIAETFFPLGKVEVLVALGEALYPPPGRRSPRENFVVAASTVANQLFLGGQYDAGASLMARLDATEARILGESSLAQARAHFARATRAMMGGDLGAVLEYARRSIAAFDEAGDLRSATLMRTNLAYVYAEIGAYEQAEAPLRRALGAAERIGLPAVIALAKQNLGLALARAGRLDEASIVEEESIALCVANEDKRLEGNSRIYLSQIRLLMGDAEGAEEQARRAIAVTAEILPMQVYARAMFAQARLAQGAVEEACAIASEAVRSLEQLGSIDDGEAQVRLIYARVLCEAGERAAAREAISKARALVLGRAAKIGDAALRESVLHRVPEHVQIMNLAAALCDGAEGP